MESWRRKVGVLLVVAAWVVSLGLVGPPGTAGTVSAAGAEPLAGCTPERAGDSCSGTAFDLTTTSVTLTTTATNVYPACTGGQARNCLFQYFVRPLSAGYNGAVGGSGTCNGTPVSGVAYVRASGPLSCTITYTWTSTDGSAYPTSLTMQAIELDGEAITLANGGHGFTTTRGAPAPVASFTSARGAGPREYTFTSTSTSRLGGLHQVWSFGDGTYAQGATATHTYANPGTYVVELDVSDRGPHEDTASQTVNTDAVTGAGTLLAVHVVTVPASDPGAFTVAVDGQPVLVGATHGREGVRPVDGGVHVVGQAAAPAYSTRLVCVDPAGVRLVDTAATQGSVPVAQGTRVDCTFTNTRLPAAAACTVPKLAGLGLAKAKKKLRKADCAVGEVVRTGQGAAVVSRSKPRAGAVRPAGTEVRLTLGRR